MNRKISTKVYHNTVQLGLLVKVFEIVFELLLVAIKVVDGALEFVQLHWVNSETLLFSYGITMSNAPNNNVLCFYHCFNV